MALTALIALITLQFGEEVRAMHMHMHMHMHAAVHAARHGGMHAAMQCCHAVLPCTGVVEAAHLPSLL